MEEPHTISSLSPLLSMFGIFRVTKGKTKH